MNEDQYKNLAGSKLLIAGQMLDVKYDERRRCFRLYQPGKRFGHVGIDTNVELELVRKLADQNPPFYFEKIHKLPLSSYILIDGRALDILVGNKIATLLPIGNSHKIKTIERENDLGVKESCYIIPNNFPKSSNSAKVNTQEIKCVYKTSWLEKKHALITKAMFEHMSRAGIINKEGFCLIGDQRCLVKPEGQAFRLSQIDRLNSEVNMTLEVFNELQTVVRPGIVPFEEVYDSRHIIVNSARWRDAYAAEFLAANKNEDLGRLVDAEKEEERKIVKEFGEKEVNPSTGEEETKIFGTASDEHHQRVWINKKGDYVACIDSKNNILITADHQNPQDVIAFRKYLSGEAQIRRTKNYTVPAIPSLQQEFRSQTESASTLKLVLDGPDDITSAINSSGIPQQQAAGVQLGLFSGFLSLVKLGVNGLFEEAGDTNKELNEVKLAIAECEEALREYVGQETITKASIKKCFESAKTLSESLQKLQTVKIEAGASATMGFPAMLSMFTATAIYDLEAILALSKTPGKELGKVFLSDAAKVPDFGPKELILPSSGITGVVAAAGYVGFLGQVLMTCYAVNKTRAAYREMKQGQEEIAEIDQTKLISEFSKKALKAIKKDQLALKRAEVAGNGLLALGQGTMALSGPIGIGLNPVTTYVGLFETLAGVGINTAAAIRESQRHGHKEEAGVVEQKINDHYIKAMLEGSLERMEKPDNAENPIAENILRAKSCSLELFAHLSSVGLVTNKVLKECYESSKYSTGNSAKKLVGQYSSWNFDNAIRRALNHYESPRRGHQKQLAAVVKDVIGSNKGSIQDEINKVKGDELSYMMMWQEYNQALAIDENDSEMIIELGGILAKHEGEDLKRAISKSKVISPELKAKIAGIADPTMENIVSAIQNEFMARKTQGIEAKINEIGDKTVAAEKKRLEFTKALLKSPFGEAFQFRVMQDKYVRENSMFHRSKEGASMFSRGRTPFSKGAKAAGKYNDDKQALKVIGKVHKSGGTGMLGLQYPHDKNVYEFNADALGTADDTYLPGNKTLREALVKESKYDLRSNWLRSMNEVGEIVAEHEAMQKVNELNVVRLGKHKKSSLSEAEEKKAKIHESTKEKAEKKSPSHQVSIKTVGRAARLDRKRVAPLPDVEGHHVKKAERGRDELMVKIIAKLAVKHKILEKDQVLGIIERAKANQGTANVESIPIEEKRFSADFQKECREHRIFYGEVDTKGWRTSRIPDNVINEIKKMSDQDLKDIGGANISSNFRS